MIRYPVRCLFSLFLCAMLSSCAMNASTTKRAVCNTLKSDIVFSGSTSDTRQSEIQSAEEPLQQKMYDRDNCDQV